MTKGPAEIDFNVFVGAETGILKGINVNNKASISKNFHNLASLEKQFEITCMNFGESQNEILLGLRNQTVKVYDVQFKSFAQSMDAKGGTGPLVGIARNDGTIVTAAESGTVVYWKCDEKTMFDPVDHEVLTMGKLKKKDSELDEDEREKHKVQMRLGKSLARMRQNYYDKNIIGVGGKEVELQVWDLSRPDTYVFRAKNVKPDMLCLRQDVWVSDLTFTSKDTVAVCSRHGQIRLYDLRTDKRRPVMELGWGEEQVANTAITSVEEQQVIVGTSAGKMGLWDFRVGQGFKGLVRKYGGCVGAVRDIATTPGNKYFCAVSLDRFLRVWKVGQGGKLATHKMYLKSRLNCALMNDTFDPEKLPVKEEEEEAQTELKNEEDSDDDIEIIEDDGEEESGDVDTPKDEVDEDALWDNMVVINSKRKKGDAKLSRKKLK
eukprot:TRINITY_DN7337_c0_g1_i1.p1 TRINITY_DN7337_c0_g1~~TRINITY_DN7337_c0_g1_i1.p1  ORF type:complete len:434 (-),score=152.92 TRINITY_DN7337_c0_g1_i1:44-1345(-)